MNKEFLTKLKCKKEAYESWKHRQVRQEKYRDTVQEIGLGKTKKQNLEKGIKVYRKGFYSKSAAKGR